MTNFENIKQMTVDEMAILIHEIINVCNETDCEDCKYSETNICMSEFSSKKWLESETEKNG